MPLHQCIFWLNPTRLIATKRRLSSGAAMCLIRRWQFNAAYRTATWRTGQTDRRTEGLIAALFYAPTVVGGHNNNACRKAFVDNVLLTEGLS